MEILGFEISVLVIGIVQVVKQLRPTMTEQGKLALALCVGFVLLSLAQALPYMSKDVAQIVAAAVRIIAYAIAIPGWFSVAKDEIVEKFVRG